MASSLSPSTRIPSSSQTAATATTIIIGSPAAITHRGIGVNTGRRGDPGSVGSITYRCRTGDRKRNTQWQQCQLRCRAMNTASAYLAACHRRAPTSWPGS
ncbi:hypothetical protein Amsp01_044010 [Amycolatopsis sp. NBRC 101858]|nr:hypothetical protein Amsp01_044010 [Amycolatopsis sp. NBRC 101858]